MGFPPGVAQSLVLQSFSSFSYKTPGDVQLKAPRKETNDSVRAKQTGKAHGSKEEEPASVVRMTSDGKKQIPVGNGGSGEGYVWTQTLREVTVYVAVPEGTTSKHLVCDITPGSIRIGVKGSEPVLSGKLHMKVKHESMWTLEDRRTVVINLDKIVETWWSCVVEGEPVIDTTKVDSTRRVDDYDAETQGAIRKIMFEQRQKQMGKFNPDQSEAESLLKNLPTT